MIIDQGLINITGKAFFIILINRKIPNMLFKEYKITMKIKI